MGLDPTDIWREIVQEDLPMFSSVSVQSYFLNGIIYCKFGEEKHNLAFDVHKEQFIIFNLPRVTSSISDKFNHNFTVFGQFEGRIGLARVKKTQFETILKVWALEDHQNSILSKHIIDIPDELIIYFCHVTPIANLPSSELLLCDLTGGLGKEHNLFYMYDPSNKKFTRLMVELPKSLTLNGVSSSAHITCFMEKITPLDDLVGLRRDE